MVHCEVNLKFDMAVLICFLVKILKIQEKVISQGSVRGVGGGWAELNLGYSKHLET